MIKSVLSKIANNIWLFICLTLGSLLITAILSSIPVYTDGALRKMLNSELINYQYDTGKTAGQYYTSINFASDYSSNGALGRPERSSITFSMKTTSVIPILSKAACFV